MNYKVYHPKNKLITSLKEHYIYKATLLLIAFFALTTTAFAQSDTCASATAAVLTVNAAPITGSVSDGTVNDPTATACAGGAVTRVAGINLPQHQVQQQLQLLQEINNLFYMLILEIVAHLHK